MDSQSTQALHFQNFPSSSSSTPRWSYDVFLNFRGEDTRKTFTDHLYKALIRDGIRTFRDDDELPRGNDISSELLKAIKESRFSIVVFSKDYASSRWCLDELVIILDCRKTKAQVVIPVFYHVDPSDVRKQTGSFEAAFASHEKRFDHEKIKKWRAALREAADLAGLPIDGSRNESEDIEQIVEKIFPYVNRELFVSKHPVGLQSRVEDLKSLLRVGSDGVCVVGIYGMGGIGKTTLAKEFFNAFIHQFESSCFVTNVREKSKDSSAMVLLQEQLLYALNGRGYKIQNESRGIMLIKEIIGCRKVLIVLDDLDHVRQLEFLAVSRSWFGKGSLIMVTTRDKHLLDKAQADVKYEVNELNYEESLELFSWHAFNRPTPSEIYVEISKDIVNYAGGHPLALEVIGSSLVDRTIEYWKSTREKLKVNPNREVQTILRISFDALDNPTLQDMFLDIACFYNMHKKYGKEILDACFSSVSYEITNLMDRCLLQKGHPFVMHDLLQQMGRQIVQEKFPREPGKHRRLWDPELVCDVLENDKGTELVEGIELVLPKQMQFSTRSFAKMPNLRFLRMQNVYLDGSFLDLFKELRWLCWKRCPLKHLSNFYPSKLVYLKMWSSNLHTLWKTTKSLNNLKVLDLFNSKSLQKTPDFTGMPNLEKLNLRFCGSLPNIHTSIGDLSKLIILDLLGCKNLKTLPSSICQLSSLQDINVGGCSNLKELPEQLGNVKSLKTLYAFGTRIKRLPQSIELLKSLESLCLHGCSRLKGLPEQLGNLECLKFLDVSGTAICHLPQSIELLPNLCMLDLEGCKQLKRLPRWNNGFRKLYCLDLSDCNLSDGDVTNDLGELSSLGELNLSRNNFSCLPAAVGKLTNLRIFKADGCSSLLKLPCLSNLTHLKELDLHNCSRLVEIQGLKNLKSIREIKLKGCTTLSSTFLNHLLQGHTGDLDGCEIQLSEQDFPNLFEYKVMERSSISIDVPSDVQHHLSRLNFWISCSLVNNVKLFAFVICIHVNNKTRGTEWKKSVVGCVDTSTLIYGPPYFGMKGGDRIEVSFQIDEAVDWKLKCGVHLVSIKKAYMDEIVISQGVL